LHDSAAMNRDWDDIIQYAYINSNKSSLPHRPHSSKMLWVRGRELLCIWIVLWVIQSRHAALLQLIHSLSQCCQLRRHLVCEIVLLAWVFFDLRMEKNTPIDCYAFPSQARDCGLSLVESSRLLSEGARGK
jgi:hypothetical protein